MTPIKKIDQNKALQEMEAQLMPGEAEAVMATLTAGDVNSWASKRISDDDRENEAAVRQHIVVEYGKKPAEAGQAYRDMVAYVQNAELTVNFNADQVFNQNVSARYENVFERSDDVELKSNRDHFESRLFRYGTIEPDSKAQEVIDRIRRNGSYDGGNNAAFRPAIRPKYGALNIFEHRTGAADDYGHSYLVLKNYMKQRCTFTGADSFLATGPKWLSNFFNMGALLRSMDDNAFDILYRKSQGQRQNLPDLILTNYFLEAQIHAEVLLTRDVSKICFDNYELSRGTAQDNRQLAATLGSFLAHNPFIAVEYFD